LNALDAGDLNARGVGSGYLDVKKDIVDLRRWGHANTS
jgi:hypothetical protein